MSKCTTAGEARGLLETEITIGAEEFAIVANVSPQHIRNLARQGKIPGRKVGRVWRFNVGQVKKYLGIED